MIEHLDADVRFHADRRAKEAYAPKEPSDDHNGDHVNDGQADPVQQKRCVERRHDALIQHFSLVQSVDQHPVKLRNDQLHIIDKDQRNRTEQKKRRIFQIVFIDVFSEDQFFFLPLGVIPRSRRYIYHTPSLRKMQDSFVSCGNIL